MNKVFVINVHQNRPGSKLDSINLETVFRSLNYDIEFLDDLDKDEFERRFEKALEDLNPLYNSIIFFILSHGQNDKFYLKNDTSGKSLEDFKDKIKCYQKLRDLPKIIFFGPCRNESKLNFC